MISAQKTKHETSSQHGQSLQAVPKYPSQHSSTYAAHRQRCCCALLCTAVYAQVERRMQNRHNSRDACTRKYTRTASFVFCVHITLLVSRYGLLSDPQSPTFRAVPLSRVGCGCTYSTLSATAATATTTGERLACPQLQTDPEIQR